MKLPDKILKATRVSEGKDFALAAHKPAEGFGLKLKKADAKALLAEGKEQLSAMQERLYADDRWSLLLIFQAMDAAGKDSTIKHVMSGVNPQGCEVHSFKAPSAEELDHDFLWRTTCRLPQRGRIGIFNRSYYEEVLVVRVHPGFLEAQRLPPSPHDGSLWEQRFDSIRDFERHMARNGTRILKFFLHVSKDEQKRRQMERIDNPDKNWKFNARDVDERAHWDRYMASYEEAIRETARPHAPWYVVPADDKWLMRVIVLKAIVAELEGLDLNFPQLDAAATVKLAEARKALEAS